VTEPVQLSLDGPRDGRERPGRPQPTPEQRVAIDARDRDVFCEAGAGTGKTRVLVERYCGAVIEEEAGPGDILAFTFTERAAAELRIRIRHELARSAAAARDRGDEGLAIRLGRAARDTERAWVTTIHGFCRRLLATHPAAAGIDPRFRVLDEIEASRLRHRARDAAIEDVLRSGERERIHVVAAYETWRIGEMTVAAYERLRSQGLAEPVLPPAPEPIRSLKDSEQGERELTPAEREGALAARDTLAALLAAFHRRYEELKAERAGLDFADLELRALELLRSSAVIASAWRGRFSHVMVDEFQDTNAVQLELVEALRGPQTRAFRVGDELQSIYRFRNADLAVFRTERERVLVDGRTAIQPLTGNFRARPGVIAAVNALGRALIGDGFRPLAHQLGERDPGVAAAELLLTLEEGKSNGWHEHAETLGGPPSVTQPKIVAEARHLASRLRELVDAGEAAPGDVVVLLRAFTHVDAYEEALERAGLDPYVVGGRGYWSQQQVEDMLRLLAAVANPLDDEMLLGALASPACGVSPDALWLLRRATQPHPDEAGKGDAGDASPGVRRSQQHLWPLIAWRFGGAERPPPAVDERPLAAIEGAEARKLERFCDRLAELRPAAPLLPLEELVERTMTTFGYDLALLARPGGRGRMANVRKLLRLAREFEAHEGRDLRAFLAAAEELTTRDEREGLAATQAEGHDGVRIMTVHAAKGLEFPVVAVPDLGRGLSQGERAGDVILGRVEPGRDGAPTARFGLRLVLADADSLGTWELHELHSESIAEAAEEGCRLVHVAATRASERLILSGSFKPSDCEPTEPEPSDTPIRRLLPALAGLGWSPEDGDREIELLSPDPAAGVKPVRRPTPLAVRLNRPGAERAAELARRLDPVVRATGPAAIAGRPPLARPQRVVPVGHLSYSALADYERCGYRFYVERLLGLDAPPAPLHPDAQRGVADEAGAEGTAVAASGGFSADGGGGGRDRDRRLGLGNAVHAALEWSARHDWDRPSDGLLGELLGEQGLADDEATLERARTLARGWFASPLRREIDGVEVRAEAPFAIELAGTIVRGQIDLLALGEEPIVVDYKTDALGDSGPSELGGRYAAQRMLYALAVAAAGTGGEPPRKVRAVHCFLEAPDDPVETSFDRQGLAAARERLEDLIGEIRGGGGFAPTPEPSWQVCNGCPAAARLCPHPGWRPPARSAARLPGTAARR
jgi:ATP-dependent helicase/nuclease subunit A